MIDLIALSAAKKHADLLAMGLISVSVDNTNKSITFTLAADGSQHTIYFDQPSDGVSIVGVEIKNGHLICLMSDGSEIDAGVLPSGGSGGSVPKPLTYDYMPEGYPRKSVQTTTLMEEQQLAFTLSDGLYMVQITNASEIVVDQTYTVNWDGTEYECVCFDFNSHPTLGNPSILGGGDDTGEPFIYMYNIGQAVGMFATLDTSASHTISVKTVTEVITPMAYDYMPEGYPTKSIQTVQLLPRSEYSFTQDHDLYLGINIPKAELVAGQTYKVMWDGTEYECISYIDANLAVVGNKHIQDNSADDTGEPFYIGDSGNNYTFAYTNSNAAAHIIGISKETEAITPMAEEFMPVLTSPNGTKYKLTVDDSGTLSATEVTE